MKEIDKISQRIRQITNRLEHIMESKRLDYEDVEEEISDLRDEAQYDLKNRLKSIAPEAEESEPAEYDLLDEQIGELEFELTALDELFKAVENKYDVYDPMSELRCMFPDEDPDEENFDDGLLNEDD